ncbi:hypothetical protein BI364_02555 [Acidihalobacter yilgarnensis]|uniref:Divalent-cation tolerance protein CutA n=1 Tax=Acidihalobacter yilgarnensis TaxID=2819280 RepID=A0A1D8IKP2_9GAMM|nr:divalent-cation tolerance protein CutA [Acidihalobacter yilgarnensis]AOU97032.1 hypothetical protein BI364_02555 [Acidihalobacter yilgarnensis]
MNDPLLVLTTHPEIEGAERLAAKLVREGLAACVNVLPAMHSFYVWEGRETSGTEHLLVIKTQDARYPQVEAAILDAHPYELPEIIATPISRGLPGYLNWIESRTS